MSRAAWRDDRRSRMEEIYDLKTRFLDALVRTGRAQVESFEVKRAGPAYWYCSMCDREWGGWNSECFGCGGDGEEVHDPAEPEVWVVVCAGEYRFHQPPRETTPLMLAMAKPGEAHDPDQPAREIPKVGLTIEAQHAVIKMAIRRLGCLGEGVAATTKATPISINGTVIPITSTALSLEVKAYSYRQKEIRRDEQEPPASDVSRLGAASRSRE